MSTFDDEMRRYSVEWISPEAEHRSRELLRIRREITVRQEAITRAEAEIAILQSRLQELV